MSKVVQYQKEPFTGSVTFSDPLSLEQEAAVERANFNLRRALQNIDGAENGDFIRVLTTLPGILACVEKWSLAGVPENPSIKTWPTRPRTAVLFLSSLLWVELSKIYLDSVDTELPNALPPQPTPTPAATAQNQENSISSDTSTVSVSRPF